MVDRGQSVSGTKPESQLYEKFDIDDRMLSLF